MRALQECLGAEHRDAIPYKDKCPKIQKGTQIMNWTDILITVPHSLLDIASDIATAVAEGGIYIEDYSDIETEVPKIAHIDLIDSDLLAKDRSVAIIHVYVSEEQNPSETLDSLRSLLDSAGVEADISIQSLKEEDWATSWKKYYRPIEISDKLVIVPQWLDYSEKQGQKKLLLDPGMAFGTGSHETTKMCLELLCERLIEGKSVMDVGCGSGIIAIAAKLLGAGTTYGFDIDAVAARTAKENAELNGVDVNFKHEDATQSEAIRYDMVCVNIVADVIIALSPWLKTVTGETLLVSGIIDTRRDEVLDVLKECGFTVSELREERGWCAAVLQPNE